MHDDTRPMSGVATPVAADAERVLGQQVGCLKAMTELLFAQLRRDLASVSDDPARAVERTVSMAEQRYQDCLTVYGTAFHEAARCAPCPPLLPELESRLVWVQESPNCLRPGLGSPWSLRLLGEGDVKPDDPDVGWFLFGPDVREYMASYTEAAMVRAEQRILAYAIAAPASHPALGVSSPPWGHPNVDAVNPCDPAGGAA